MRPTAALRIIFKNRALSQQRPEASYTGLIISPEEQKAGAEERARTMRRVEDLEAQVYA